ncbi:MAG: thioesterase family protein [Christensenellaceae bacterium]|nr:thioesterase family protein [Christensenellaceae bacterium]
MELRLEPGAKARVEKTVEYKDTARAVASGLAEVFATPSMIALMENAAYLAVQPLLPEGMSTVGVRIDAKHIAATPMGLKVWAEAVLVEADGRRLTFDIEAFDEKEKIGEARHERFIIDEQKFMSRAKAKGRT